MKIVKLFNSNWELVKEKHLVFQVPGEGQKGKPDAQKMNEQKSGLTRELREAREGVKNGSANAAGKSGENIGELLTISEKAPDPMEILKRMDYGYVSPFDGNVAVAGKDGKFFLINEKGEKKPGFYDDAHPPREGRVGVKVGSKWHFVDGNGKDLKFGEFDEVYLFYGGVAGVRSGRYWKFIKADGKSLNDKTYERVEDFDISDGTVVGKRNGKWITIDKKGEEIKTESVVRTNYHDGFNHDLSYQEYQDNKKRKPEKKKRLKLD